MVKDKVIIVTGAARGLGQKYSIEFAKAGASIVFADISDCRGAISSNADNRTSAADAN